MKLLQALLSLCLLPSRSLCSLPSHKASASSLRGLRALKILSKILKNPAGGRRTQANLFMANNMDVSLPPLPPSVKYPLIVNYPGKNRPMARRQSPADQKPIYLVPQIVYPELKKKRLVNHSFPRDNALRTLLALRRDYLDQARANDAYRPFVAPDSDYDPVMIPQNWMGPLII